MPSSVPSQTTTTTITTISTPTLTATPTPTRPSYPPPSYPSPSPKLLSVPPELLLQIISHLPASSSLHALSQTSHSLHVFLHIHASTITNSLITKHHSFAAEILGARHVEESGGFLVPCHKLVEREEKRREREVVRGCRCAACKRIFYSRTSSSFDDDEVVQDFPDEGTGEEDKSGSESERESQSDKQKLVPCLPSSLISRKATARGKECKAKTSLSLEKMTRLTAPGPQFLVFLERYGWEIEARWDIYIRQSRSLGRVDEEDEDQDRDRYGDERKDLSEEERERELQTKTKENLNSFEFMIGNYCVRRFLEDINKEMDGVRKLVPVDKQQKKKKTTTTNKTFKDRLSSLLTFDLNTTYARSKKATKQKNPEEKKKKNPDIPIPHSISISNPTSNPTSTPLIFGEIEKTPDNNPILAKDPWIKGILWYHGHVHAHRHVHNHNHFFNSDPTPSLQHPIIQSPNTPTTLSLCLTKTKVKSRTCISGMENGVRNMGVRMKGVFARFHCAGRFEVLDD